MQCDLEGEITYNSWRNKGQQDIKKCYFNNAWSLVMDLGYNHIGYHFLAEGQHSNNFSNPFDRTRYAEW
jgi:hypothetical protein